MVKTRKNKISKGQNGVKNLLGKPLEMCASNTGYFRDGYCNTGPTNTGTHVVCSKMTDKFLKFTKSKDNNLITPGPGFPGLKQGDKWCLCALRWKEAYDAGVAPPVIPESTNNAFKRFLPTKVSTVMKGGYYRSFFSKVYDNNGVEESYKFFSKKEIELINLMLKTHVEKFYKPYLIMSYGFGGFYGSGLVSVKFKGLLPPMNFSVRSKIYTMNFDNFTDNS
jgi:uncharacterized protein (DUF2237 family)